MPLFPSNQFVPNVVAPVTPDIDLLSLVINVNDAPYYAKGDGVTDDWNAIQSAINAAPLGSIIFFPALVYLVGSTVQLKAGLSYIGTTGLFGGGSIIKQKNGANLPAVVASNGWYNNTPTSENPLAIKNLVIDGNSANNTTSHGIVLMNYNSIIRECYVTNAPGCGIVESSISRNGTSISNTAVENRIESCKIDNAGIHGIWIHDSTGAATDGYINSCLISATVQDGVNAEQSAGWFIQNNHIYDIGMNGYNLFKCFSTYFTNNEVDGYGISSTPGYYTGVSLSLIGPRASVVEGNIICVGNEFVDTSTFGHLVVTGSGNSDTNAIVCGNSVLGGYVNTTSTTSLVSGAKTPCTPVSMDGIFAGIILFVQNETITVASITATTFTPSTNWVNNHGPGSYFIGSNKSAGNSTGLTYSSNSTQQASGQPCTIISYGNQVKNVGHYSFFDGIALVGPVGVDGTVALSQTPNYAIVTLANGNTISTVGLGSIVVNTTSNVTGILLQAGTQAGQTIVINNEGTGNITFAALGTSLVADGVNDIIPAQSAKLYIWDSTAFAWSGVGNAFQFPNNAPLIMYSDAYTTATLQLNGGTVCLAQSASEVATATSGTIATANIGVSRVAPTGNITGVILQAGTIPGQTVTIWNNSAFTITFAAVGTSNVADGVLAVVAANKKMDFTWNSVAGKWAHN